MDKKLLSVIVPFYNEEENLPAAYHALVDVVKLLPNYHFEFIFVDDGSNDHGLQFLEQTAAADPRVHFIQFSRNFGKEFATTAGLDHAQGDAVIMLDADLQHPPSLIPEFVQKWEQGAEVVVGMRTNNAHENAIKRWGSILYYRIVNVIGETKISSGGTDFRLMDRKVVREFQRFPERARITRGLVDWLGFERAAVEFVAPERHAGTSAYGTIKLFRLAISSLLAHSLFPLRISGYLGFLIILLSVPVGIFVGITKFFLGNPFSFTGPATLAIIIVFLVGIVLACLGLIALYIENIHVEVAGRPLYVIRKSNVPRKSQKS